MQQPLKSEQQASAGEFELMKKLFGQVESERDYLRSKLAALTLMLTQTTPQ
jgi:hypothetical protein